jgi:3-oxoacyl-[acyl-carrier-protein] synthase II
MSTHVAVTGVAVLLPGARDTATLLRGWEPGAEPVRPADLVGRKGLRYKDRATQLGYCLAQAALADAALLDPQATAVDSAADPAAESATVGVVASSNFGNLDTVTSALDTIRKETVTGTSPMDLPNASSNVIASSVAIRFGLRGPNVMLCNGETSGLDAVHLAAGLVCAGRAERVLVLGVEPDNATVRALLRGERAVDGGAALVLESATAARERGAAVRALVGEYARKATPQAVADRLGDVPAASWRLPEHAGRASGALGVLQCAAAVGLFDDGARESVSALAHEERDADAGLVLHPPESA